MGDILEAVAEGNKDPDADGVVVAQARLYEECPPSQADRRHELRGGGRAARAVAE